MVKNWKIFLYIIDDPLTLILYKINFRSYVKQQFLLVSIMTSMLGNNNEFQRCTH